MIGQNQIFIVEQATVEVHQANIHGSSGVGDQSTSSSQAPHANDKHLLDLPDTFLHEVMMRLNVSTVSRVQMTAASMRGVVMRMPDSGIKLINQLDRGTYELYRSSAGYIIGDDRLALALSQQTDPNVLRRLAEVEDEQVLIAVAQNKSTPMDVLEKMAMRAELSIKSAVAANPAIDYALMEQFVTSDDWHLRRAVASNPAIEVTLLQRLLQDPRAEVRQAVARSEEATATMLRVLAGDPVWEVRMAVAKNFNAPADVLRDFGRYHDLWPGGANLVRLDPRPGRERVAITDLRTMRATVAGNVSAPEDLLLALTKDRDWKVRRAVAANGSATPTVLRVLSKHDVWEVTKAVLKNRYAPQDVLRHYGVMQDRPRGAVAHFLRQFSYQIGGANVGVLDARDARLLVACHPDTPLDLLQTLAKDQEPAVRAAVARHPKIPPDLVQSINAGLPAMLLGSGDSRIARE